MRARKLRTVPVGNRLARFAAVAKVLWTGWRGLGCRGVQTWMVLLLAMVKNIHVIKLAKIDKVLMRCNRIYTEF